ncbi:MAG: Zn-dependent protease, partial [Methylobacteriaceae bacterium]|nr:Zn-dependent protease [Methylobacteriaceae bacterium]
MRRRLFAVLGAFAIGAALLVTGCTTILPDPPANPAATPALPSAVPRTTGVDTPAMREHKRLIAIFGGEYHAPAAERLLNDVLAKIA